MTELIWNGKYKDGKKVALVRIGLPFQTIETVIGTIYARSLSLTQISKSPTRSSCTRHPPLLDKLK
jgi:hypothetical protein